MTRPVILKFGGSFLRGHADLVRAAHIIYREVREGRRVIAVTSAFYGRTDELAATLDGLESETQGSAGDPHAPRRKRAALLGTGEIETAALLAATLERSGIPARIADVRSTGPFVAPLTEEDAPDDDTCRPTRVDVEALEQLLREAAVVCLPGFIAAEDCAARHPALLGRGGSDLTAVFVGDALDAPVVLVKDVDGLYSSDPSRPTEAKPIDAGPIEFGQGTLPRRLARVSYDDAKALDSTVLQRRALDFAEAARQEIRVVGPRAVVGQRGTTVGAAPTSAQSSPSPRRPVRVALLGLGTVGTRVFAEVSGAPDLFDVTSILVRRGGEVARPKAAQALLTQSFDEVLATAPEILIEATGGAEPAGHWIAEALRRGIHVVSANKVAVAQSRPRLDTVARRHGVQFLASAAVGGSVPAVETVTHWASSQGPDEQLVGVSGVLNGTSNAILESLREGHAWQDAVEAAQLAGLAEADPTSDLDGSDIACKLELIARAAGWLDGDQDLLRWVRRDSLVDGVSKDLLAVAAASGQRLRLVGTVHPTEAEAGAGAVASIELNAVGPGDPFFELGGAANALVLEHARRPATVVYGIGAGAWPTATAIMGDVFAICRRLRLTENESTLTVPPPGQATSDATSGPGRNGGPS